VTLASRLNLHLIVGHHRRFNSYVTTTKRLLDNSSLGRVIALVGIWATYKPDSYFASPTVWRRSAVSGGPIFINLIHEIDILHYLFGPIVLVHAEATVSQRGYEAEEGAAIILKFESGLVGTFLLSDATPSPWNFEACTGENPMIARVGENQGFLKIIGAEGSLSVGDMSSWSYGEAVKKSWTNMMNETRVAVDKAQRVPFELQVANLVGVVRGKESPVCSGAEGVRAVVVCEAIKRATLTGKPVSNSEILGDAARASKI
jgi:predicted dehydrogenase